MSWRRELGEIRREREDLIRRDERLRWELRDQGDQFVMYLQIAGQLLSLVGLLVGGRRARRTHRRRS